MKLIFVINLLVLQVTGLTKRQIDELDPDAQAEYSVYSLVDKILDQDEKNTTMRCAQVRDLCSEIYHLWAFGSQPIMGKSQVVEAQPLCIVVNDCVRLWSTTNLLAVKQKVENNLTKMLLDMSQDQKDEAQKIVKEFDESIDNEPMENKEDDKASCIDDAMQESLSQVMKSVTEEVKQIIDDFRKNLERLAREKLKLVMEAESAKRERDRKMRNTSNITNTTKSKSSQKSSQSLLHEVESDDSPKFVIPMQDYNTVKSRDEEPSQEGLLSDVVLDVMSKKTKPLDSVKQPLPENANWQPADPKRNEEWHPFLTAVEPDEDDGDLFEERRENFI